MYRKIVAVVLLVISHSIAEDLAFRFENTKPNEHRFNLNDLDAAENVGGTFKGVSADLIAVEDRRTATLLVLRLKNTTDREILIPKREVHSGDNLKVILDKGDPLPVGLEDDFFQLKNPPVYVLPKNGSILIRLRVEDYAQFRELHKKKGGVIAIRHLAFTSSYQVFRATPL